MPKYLEILPDETPGYNHKLVYESVTSLVIDLNVITTCINFVAQYIILAIKLGRPNNDFDMNLALVSFGSALITCIGTIVSFTAYKSIPKLKVRCGINVFFALVMLGVTTNSVAVRADHTHIAYVICITNYLLFVIRRSTPMEETCFLLAGHDKRRVPVLVSSRPGGRVRRFVRRFVSSDHVHLLTSVYRARRNEALSAAKGEEVIDLYLAEAPKLSEYLGEAPKLSEYVITTS